MTALRIGFMGTPEFSVPALRALCESVHKVVCVYTQPPRPKGRGQNVQLSPVHAYAEQRNIPVFNPLSLKNNDEQQQFISHELDVAIVAAYGLILPKAVLNAPKYGCINIHASLLPRWRGASPIQRAIMAGDSEAGVTLMQMDEGLDTGPMIAKGIVPITARTTSSNLHDELSKLGATMILEALDTLSKDKKLRSQPQDNASTTYAPLLKKEDGKIDWSRSSEETDRVVRALNPWPGTFSILSGRRFKILEVELGAEQTNLPPGTIINTDGYVACGNAGIIRISKIQPENSKAMDFAAAVNGGYIKAGEVFT